MRVAFAVGAQIRDELRISLAVPDDALFHVATTATPGDAVATREARRLGLVVELCFAPRGDRQERNRRMLDHADSVVVVCDPGADPDMDDLVVQAQARGVPVSIC